MIRTREVWKKCSGKNKLIDLRDEGEVLPRQEGFLI